MTDGTRQRAAVSAPSLDAPRLDVAGAVEVAPAGLGSADRTAIRAVERVDEVRRR